MVEEVIKITNRIEQEADKMVSSDTPKTETDKTLEEAKSDVEKAIIFASKTICKWKNEKSNESIEEPVKWGSNIKKTDMEIEL